MEITKSDYNRIMGIARCVSRRLGTQFWAEDFCNEYLADVCDGRFYLNGKSTHPYLIMMHYYREWEKPRTSMETKLAYWRSCSRKPLLPIDFFELKELWGNATDMEKEGIYSLMISYGGVHNKKRGAQSKRAKAGLYRLRKKNGIKIDMGNSKRTRIKRSKK